jgi:hypothetical protein
MRYDDALLPRRTNGACGLSRRIQKKPDSRALPIINRRFEGRDGPLGRPSKVETNVKTQSYRAVRSRSA